MKNIESTKDNIENLNKKIPILINKEIYNKIFYVTKKINDVEWSGILLYEAIGDITDLDTLSLQCKDIIVMSKDEKSSTSFKFNEEKRDLSGNIDRHIQYCENKKEALNYKIGLIHSHNTFDTFFSGTDMSELKDGTNSHNFYVSVITNNKMELIGKIAFKTSVEILEETKFKIKNRMGEDVEIYSSKEEKKDIIACCDLEIILENEEITDLDFINNVNQVIEEAKQRVQDRQIYKNNYFRNNHNNMFNRYTPEKYFFNEDYIDFDEEDNIPYKNSIITKDYFLNSTIILENTLSEFLNCAKGYKNIELELSKRTIKISEGDRFYHIFMHHYFKKFKNDIKSIPTVLKCFEELVETFKHKSNNHILKLFFDFIYNKKCRI